MEPKAQAPISTQRTPGKKTYDIRVNIPGLFNAQNALAAISVLEDFELPQETTALVQAGPGEKAIWGPHIYKLFSR